MKILKYIKDIQPRISEEKGQGNSIGFVPTMGALHKGHLSLIEASKKNDDIAVVSIFVNPTQFNDPGDLEKYPRTLEKDLELLEKASTDIVFIPEVNEIYPEKDPRVFDMGGLDAILEGKYRPGHFNGVVQVVTRFFNIINPHKAYFGIKDFQQLTIIKYIVNSLHLPMEIIPCPIVREKDGLAMSSRNSLLSSYERKIAVNIPQALLYVKKNAAKFSSIEIIKKYVIEKLSKIPEIRLEYFEIIDDINLQPIKSLNHPGKKIGCIAAWVGNVRLIDNINIYS